MTTLNRIYHDHQNAFKLLVQHRSPLDFPTARCSENVCYQLPDHLR